MAVTKNKVTTIKLTPQGYAVAERAKERRKEAEDQGKEYVRDPWYYAFLSEEFKEKVKRGEVKPERLAVNIPDEEFSEELMDDDSYNNDYDESDYIDYSDNTSDDDE